MEKILIRILNVCSYSPVNVLENEMNSFQRGAEPEKWCNGASGKERADGRATRRPQVLCKSSNMQERDWLIAKVLLGLALLWVKDKVPKEAEVTFNFALGEISTS